MPNYAEIISTIALLVSFGSLGVSFFAAFHDRPRLKITSRFIPSSAYGEGRILLTFINSGRRPVIIRSIGGSTDNGQWAATLLSHEEGGYRLDEHERYERSMVKEDTIAVHPEDDDFVFDYLWIEDSLGNRYKVSNSREYIRQLWS